MYDIVIIGSGPAGATLARLLDKKFKVAIIDKKILSSENEGFMKPCGGLLAPDAQKAMAKFGLSFPSCILVEPQIFAVETIDINSMLVNYYQRFYLNFDRHKFDIWLSSLIPSYVDIIDNATCISTSKVNDLFEIKYLKNGKENILHSKYIVGADGSNSIVRKNYVKKKIRQYVSIQQWFKQDKNTPFYVSFFDEEFTDCYGWINFKNGYLILGAALPKNNCRENFEKLKEKLTKFGYSFEGLEKTEACLVSRPSSISEICLGTNNAFLIGEAAGFISPSSLEGISYALETAYALSNAFNKSNGSPLLHYKRETFSIRFKLFLKLLKIPFMYWPFLRRIVMKSQLSAIKIKS